MYEQFGNEIQLQKRLTAKLYTGVSQQLCNTPKQNDSKCLFFASTFTVKLMLVDLEVVS